MTTTDLEQGTFVVGVRAVYDDRQYDVGLLSRYFASVSTAWDSCLTLAGFRSSAEFARAKKHARDLLQLLEESPVEDKLSIQNALEGSLQSLKRTQLVAEDTARLHRANLAISRLRIESPMELTMALVQAGGALGVSVYGIHLLRQVLHDPERVGSWLPRLIESWHRGMAGAEAARYEREQAEQKREQQENPMADVSRQLIEAAEGIVEFRVVEVEAVGAGDPPDDLVAATDNFLG